MRRSTWRAGLMSLCLALCASGCARAPQLVSAPATAPVLPPAALLQPVPEPDCAPSRNWDLLTCIHDLRLALREANASLEVLGRWAAGAEASADIEPPPAPRPWWRRLWSRTPSTTASSTATP